MDEIETVENWEKIKDLAWEHDLTVDAVNYGSGSLQTGFNLYLGTSEKEREHRIPFYTTNELLSYLQGYKCAMCRKNKVEDGND